MLVYGFVHPWQCRRIAGCSALAVEMGEEMVYGVWQYAVYRIYGCVVVFVASESFYPLPHASGVVTGKVFLHTLLVSALGLSVPLYRPAGLQI